MLRCALQKELYIHIVNMAQLLYQKKNTRSVCFVRYASILFFGEEDLALYIGTSIGHASSKMAAVLL